MTIIFDLSDAILLHITSYLRPDHSAGLTGKPVYFWSQILAKQAGEVKAYNKDLKSLVLSCNRFYSVFVQQLYRTPCITQNRYTERQYLTLLDRTLEDDWDIGSFIRTAHLDLDEPDTGDFYKLFFLPNIHTLSIKGFQACEKLEWEDPSVALELVGTSPLRTLYLVSCGAREEPLTQILSWPAALEHLYYDCDQMGWTYYFEGGTPGLFTSKGVERAVLSQCSSLETFVFSRERQPHEGLGYPEGDDYINLSLVVSLKSLSISHVFLVGWQAGRNVYSSFPKNLMELEVYYDDTGYHDFLTPEAPRPEWLFELLSHKAQYAPKLERVRVISPEHYEDAAQDEEEEDEELTQYDQNASGPEVGSISDLVVAGTGHPGSKWTPPQELITAFVKAKVSFSIYIHPRKRFRLTIDGGRGFKDSWEDVWNPQDYAS